MTQTVDIKRVIPLNDSSSRWAVKKMRDTLTKQGQIEPLQVHAVGSNYIVWHDDPWGNELVYAARELGWETLLIVETRGYDKE